MMMLLLLYRGGVSSWGWLGLSTTNPGVVQDICCCGGEGIQFFHVVQFRTYCRRRYTYMP